MTKRHQDPPIHLGSPGEDISREDIQTIKLRFKRLNQLREQRVQDFLQPRQQVFLDVLPLLFHCNFPLPGLFLGDTRRIPEYNPGSRAINAARQLAKFQLQPRGITHYTYRRAVLMVASAVFIFKTSDMDIWLSSIGLSPDAIDELQKPPQ
jgi:adenylate cyclase class 1